ncbi:iron ABC transporter substrate-binding protein [Paeniglutamicibacter sp. ZC-3]|uniref:iron ABC transporter substrate-binding protein n=1 Tax=Paeniglutamicibacter sp. ZC-3 TaxID=2986919 RepID=UPI0021F754C8|nr:iron ABC transporter substrate-binding protein [Paeniglutamicibacter sp. ZC-3]MCV9994152.1 iron ABC transporter substrate-binding protein [Paeniglutamicibacter sp. ZC-3]
MPNQRKKILGLTGSLLAAALLLSACSAATGDNAQSENEAAGKGSLVVYSGRDAELIDPLIKQFEESSGIDVRVRYSGTTELAAQLIEEGERTPAQVFLSQDAGALGAVSAEKLFSELPADVTSLVPAEYTSVDGAWVGLTGRARVVAYDSEKYTEDQVPGDVFGLLDAKYKGEIGFAPTNASFQAFVTALRVEEGEERAREWLEGLVANDAQAFARNGEILEAVNSGAIGLGLINHYYWARSEQDPASLRAQLKFGDAGSVSALVNVTGAGILKNSAESSEAMAFVKFLLSEQAQTFFVEETAEYALVEGMDSPAGVPPLSELGGPDINLSELSSLEETIKLITEVGLL